MRNEMLCAVRSDNPWRFQVISIQPRRDMIHILKYIELKHDSLPGGMCVYSGSNTDGKRDSSGSWETGCQHLFICHRVQTFHLAHSNFGAQNVQPRRSKPLPNDGVGPATGHHEWRRHGQGTGNSTERRLGCSGKAHFS